MNYKKGIDTLLQQNGVNKGLMSHIKKTLIFLIFFISQFSLADDFDTINTKGNNIVRFDILYEYTKKKNINIFEKKFFDLLMEDSISILETGYCVFAFIRRSKNNSQTSVFGVMNNFHEEFIAHQVDEDDYQEYPLCIICKFEKIDGSPYVLLYDNENKVKNGIVNHVKTAVGDLRVYNRRFEYNQNVKPSYRKNTFKIRLQLESRFESASYLFSGYEFKHYPMEVFIANQIFHGIKAGSIDLTESYDLVEIITEKGNSIYLSKNISQRLLNVISTKWNKEELNCEPDEIKAAYQKSLHQSGWHYYLTHITNLLEYFGFFSDNHLLDLNYTTPCTCVFMYIAFGVKDLSKYPKSPKALIDNLGGSIEDSISKSKFTPGSLIIVTNNGNNLDNEALIYLGYRLFLSWGRGPSFFFIRHAKNLENMFSHDYTVKYFENMLP